MIDSVKSIRCGHRLLSLEEPVVMGIMNLTPDSFYDGGRLDNTTSILDQGRKMLEEGAQILDLGAMSSRPGARIISVEEEWDRLFPGLKTIRTAFPDAYLSVDTVHAQVAERAVLEGADLINDISAGSLDAHLWDVVARLKVPYVLMHMRGTPENMQKHTKYEDVLLEVLDFLIERTGELRAKGVTDIILDPGFGFGKSVEQNYRLLSSMHSFSMLGLPVLAGISRKSMIGKVLGTTPAENLNGTTALHMVALQQGASILRVHDVREAVEVIKLWQQLGRPLHAVLHSKNNETVS